MLTVFTIPKAFADHTGIIQRNAIESWRRLDQHADVILFGDETGVSEAAAEHGVRHIGDVQTNEYGTPLVSHVFQLAQRHAQHDTFCYVNADVILTSDLARAVRGLELPEFVMTGRRCNVDITRPIEFDGPAWEEAVRRRIRDEGQLAPRWAMDYFVVRGSGFLKDIPPFAVGRPIWDNWFIYNACCNGVPVVDAGTSAMAVHQNHDYNHIPGATGWKWEGPEADANRNLVGPWDHVYGLDDATHVLTEIGLVSVDKRTNADCEMAGDESDGSSRVTHAWRRPRSKFKSLPVVAQIRVGFRLLRDAGRWLRAKRTVKPLRE